MKRKRKRIRKRTEEREEEKRREQLLERFEADFSLSSLIQLLSLLLPTPFSLSLFLLSLSLSLSLSHTPTTGQWFDDVRQGTGTYTYANGDSYEGKWLSNARDGEGIYTYAATGCQVIGGVEGKLNFSLIIRKIGRGDFFPLSFVCLRLSFFFLSYSLIPLRVFFLNDITHLLFLSLPYTLPHTHISLSPIPLSFTLLSQYVGSWVKGRRQGQGQIVNAGYRFAGTFTDDQVSMCVKRGKRERERERECVCVCV